MRRREFLTITVSGAAVALLTGCLGSVTGNQVKDSDGDGMVDDQDYAPKDPNVQSKSDVNAESNRAGSSQSSTQNGGDSQDTGSGGESSFSTDNTEQKQKILETYNDGIGITNQGTRLMDQSISAYNNEQFSDSITKAKSAESKYKEAEQKFSTAVNLSLQIGHQSAVDIATNAQKYALHMQESSLHGQMAAKASINGDIDRANEFATMSREAYNNAKQTAVRNPSALKSALSL
jgi:hypothetical protein